MRQIIHQILCDSPELTERGSVHPASFELTVIDAKGNKSSHDSCLKHLSTIVDIYSTDELRSASIKLIENLAKADAPKTKRANGKKNNKAKLVFDMPPKEGTCWCGYEQERVQGLLAHMRHCDTALPHARKEVT